MARNHSCSGARRHGTAAPRSRVTCTHGRVHTLSPSSGTWCLARAGPQGPAQGISRRHRASTALLGPWATPPMTKSRLGAGQLEQEQRPVGMGGSGSHFFRERLNPSTESSGQDWFPAGDGTASASPAALPAAFALPVPRHTPLMPQLEPPAVAGPRALGCGGSGIPGAISRGTRGLAAFPWGGLPAPMPHCGLCPCASTPQPPPRDKGGQLQPQQHSEATPRCRDPTSTACLPHHLLLPCGRRSGLPRASSAGSGSPRCRAGGAAAGAGLPGQPSPLHPHC